MCNDVMLKTCVEGTGFVAGEPIELGAAVVSFVHPLDITAEHAVCIDLRGTGGDPADRIAVELSVGSARQLAELLLAALDQSEASTTTRSPASKGTVSDFLGLTATP